MAPQVPAAPAPGDRELRPRTRGAAARGEVGLGARVRGELRETQEGTRRGDEETVLAGAGDPCRRRWGRFLGALGTDAGSDP